MPIRYAFWQRTQIDLFCDWPESLLRPATTRRKPVVSKRTQAVKLQKKFRLFQVKLAIEQENILGEYSSFFKPSMWNYLHLEGINLYQNDW